MLVILIFLKRLNLTKQSLQLLKKPDKEIVASLHYNSIVSCFLKFVYGIKKAHPVYLKTILYKSHYFFNKCFDRFMYDKIKNIEKSI